MKNSKFVTHDEVKKALFEKDPSLKAAYDEAYVDYELFLQVLKLRMELSLSQQEFAQKIGTSQANISKLENGNLNPSVAFLRKIANSFGKKLEIRFI